MPLQHRPATGDGPPIAFFLADDFNDFTYSKHSHLDLFADGDCERRLYGKKTAGPEWGLKRYQDLLVFSFIVQHLSPGSRLLEVGGGNSRIIARLKDEHECWNLDKLEGSGQGPLHIDTGGFRLVKDYMGSFNPELPAEYFDFVFSISALEHVPGRDVQLHESIATDLDRVLKPGGYSLHCLDSVLRAEHMWVNPLLHLLFSQKRPLNRFVPFRDLKDATDVFFLPEELYDKHWRPNSNRSYEEYGRPFSYNILWRKAG